MPHEIKPGCIIKSRAGRDKGKYFMVYSFDGGEYVYLVDGVLRKLAAPKKKKVKHIDHTGQVLETLGQKIQQEMKIFDAEVRRALEEAGFANRPRG